MSSRIILMHGFLGDVDDWAGVTADLTVGSAPVAIPLALIGAGRPSTIADLAQAALGYLRAAEVAPPWHLVGYSMGGRVALAMHSLAEGAVDRITLESAHPGLDGEAERAARRRLDAARAVELRELGSAAFVETWYALPLFASLRADPAVYAAVLERRSEADALRWSAILRGCSPGVTEPRWDRLAAMGHRLQFLSGALDPKYCALGVEISRRATQARVEVVPGAGHNIHREAPAEFVRRVLAFRTL